MWQRLALARTNVSKELIASIIRVKLVSKLVTALAVTSWRTLFTLTIEGTCSFETEFTYKSHTASLLRRWNSSQFGVLFKILTLRDLLYFLCWNDCCGYFMRSETGYTQTWSLKAKLYASKDEQFIFWRRNRLKYSFSEPPTWRGPVHRLSVLSEWRAASSNCYGTLILTSVQSFGQITKWRQHHTKFILTAQGIYSIVTHSGVWYWKEKVWGLIGSEVEHVMFRSEIQYDMKNDVFWNVTSCGSCKKRRFGGKCRRYHQGGKAFFLI
jgi:hypothetical protein